MLHIWPDASIKDHQSVACTLGTLLFYIVLLVLDGFGMSTLLACVSGRYSGPSWPQPWAWSILLVSLITHQLVCIPHQLQNWLWMILDPNLKTQGKWRSSTKAQSKSLPPSSSFFAWANGCVEARYICLDLRCQHRLKKLIASVGHGGSATGRNSHRVADHVQVDRGILPQGLQGVNHGLRIGLRQDLPELPGVGSLMVQLWQQRGHQWWFWERRVKSPRLEPRYTNSIQSVACWKIL